MLEILEIKDVNLKLLEKQRILANSLYSKVMGKNEKAITPNEKDALNGILAMLDSWSDNLYFAKGKK